MEKKTFFQKGQKGQNKQEWLVFLFKQQNAYC